MVRGEWIYTQNGYRPFLEYRGCTADCKLLCEGREIDLPLRKRHRSSIQSKEAAHVGGIMKALRVTMPDGSSWDVPISVIYENWWAYYKDKDDVEFEDFDDSDCIDWSANNMNWSDVKDHARMVEVPDEVDYEDGWANGDREVIEF